MCDPTFFIWTAAVAHRDLALLCKHIVLKAAYDVTGRREWPAFVDWFSENLQPSLEGWIGPVEVVYEGAKPLPADGRYVFGYQPHGLFPIGEAGFCAATCKCSGYLYAWLA